MKWYEPIDYSKRRMWNRDHTEKHSGFLFFPRTCWYEGRDETRWLVFANWTERFHLDEKGKKDWSSLTWDWW